MHLAAPRRPSPAKPIQPGGRVHRRNRATLSLSRLLVAWPASNHRKRTHLQALQKLGMEVRDRIPIGFVRLVLDSTGPTTSASAPRSLFNTSIEIFQEASGGTGEEVLARVDLMPGRSGVHFIDFERTTLMSSCVGRGPVSAIVADHRGLRATYGAGLLTAFEDNDISGCVKLSDYYANVAAHVAGVLVWRWNTVWFANSRGRVIWKAEFSKVVRSVIPNDVGFMVLAGHLFSFRYLLSTERRSP